jgi:hypothetical protein
VNAAWLTALTALAVAVVTLGGWAARKAWGVLGRTRDFLDDWQGEAPRPGVDARAGVMARLQAVEFSVARVAAETQPNGGQSLRDVLQRTAADVADLKTAQAQTHARMELFERQRANREGDTRC